MGLALFAIEHVADGFAACGVHFRLLFSLVSVHFFLLCFHIFFGALRTAIGKAGLVRLELKFFTTDDAGFDREQRHNSFILSSRRGSAYGVFIETDVVWRTSKVVS